MSELVTSTTTPDLSTRFVEGALVDHHCHGLVTRQLDRAAYESLLNEGVAPGPLGTTFFDSMLGLAVRRWCAPVLDLEPLASADDYLERRRELGSGEVNRRLVRAAGISDFVVDTGYLPEPITSAAELASLSSGRGHEVARLEAVAEELLADAIPAGGLPEALVARLQQSGAVAAKSIAAYRVGLELPATKPTDGELASAVAAMSPGASGQLRIADPVINGFLAWTAIEQGLPLQFHVGYGDNDVDLRSCDPLLLTGFLRATQERGVPVLLLHNYPFHRHAAYLAQVFDHVFMDVGLAVHNTGALSSTIIRESLELVPFAKMLFSSDAFGLAELYLLGAGLFRRGLSSVLEGLIDDGEIGEADALHIGALIGAENARRAYRLQGS
jgi:uncharacterized protein